MKKRKRGGARDDAEPHINYTRKQLTKHLKRVETKLLLIEERKQNQKQNEPKWRT